MRTRHAILFAATALTAAAAATATETISYGYDARGRLVTVQHSGTVNNNVATSYSYDKADNRTLKATGGGPAQCLLAAPNGPVPIPIPICGS